MALFDLSHMDDKSQRPVVQGLSAYGAVAGVGFVGVLMMVLAIVIGKQLDLWLGPSPLFVLLLILISIPLSLLMMTRSALAAARVTHAPGPSQAGQQVEHEEDNT